MRVLAFAMLAVAAAVCAHADPLEGFDAGRLETCVSSAHEAGDADSRCLGAGARPCIEAEGPSTMSEALCWSHEADWWGARVNAVEARLMERDPPRAAALGRASGSYNLFVGNECAYRGDTFDGGSGAQPAMARCAAELWAARAVMLLNVENLY